MPQVLKYLTTVIVWILFISGCITELVSMLNWIFNIGLFGYPDSIIFMGLGVGSAQLFLAAVVVKLRQMLE